MIFTVKTDGKKATLYNSITNTTKTVVIDEVMPLLKNTLTKEQMYRIYRPIRRAKIKVHAGQDPIDYKIVRIYGDYSVYQHSITSVQIHLVTGEVIHIGSADEEELIQQYQISDNYEQELIRVFSSLVTNQTKVGNCYIDSIDDVVSVTEKSAYANGSKAITPFGFIDNQTGELLVFYTYTAPYFDKQQIYEISLCSAIYTDNIDNMALPLRKLNGDSYLTLCTPIDNVLESHSFNCLELTKYQLADKMAEYNINRENYIFPVMNHEALEKFYLQMEINATPYLSVLAEDRLLSGNEPKLTIPMLNGYITLDEELSLASSRSTMAGTTSVFSDTIDEPYVICEDTLYNVKRNIKKLQVHDFRDIVTNIKAGALDIHESNLYIFNGSLKNIELHPRYGLQKNGAFNVKIYPMKRETVTELIRAVSYDRWELSTRGINIIVPLDAWLNDRNYGKEGLLEILLLAILDRSITVYFTNTTELELTYQGFVQKRYPDPSNYSAFYYSLSNISFKLGEEQLVTPGTISYERVLRLWQGLLADTVLYLLTKKTKIIKSTAKGYKCRGYAKVNYTVQKITEKPLDTNIFLTGKTAYIDLSSLSVDIQEELNTNWNLGTTQCLLRLDFSEEVVTPKEIHLTLRALEELLYYVDYLTKRGTQTAVYIQAKYNSTWIDCIEVLKQLSIELKNSNAEWGMSSSSTKAYLNLGLFIKKISKYDTKDGNAYTARYPLPKFNKLPNLVNDLIIALKNAR